jgi:hypothetical protein
MTDHKTVEDKAVQDALNGNGDFPAKTFINFGQPDKLAQTNRTYDQFLANATSDNVAAAGGTAVETQASEPAPKTAAKEK